MVDAQDLKSCGWLHPCRFDSGPRYLAYAPIAQLDRVLDYESSGYRFDSCWVHTRELAQLGRALGLGPRGRRFESCLPDSKINFGGLAQLGERLLCTQEVSGSIPLVSTI